jgi:hypothetical protein
MAGGGLVIIHVSGWLIPESKAALISAIHPVYKAMQSSILDE